MAITVRNVTKKNGRYKYRVGIRKDLRPFIEGNITEFVRWLGPVTGKTPSAAVLEKHTAAVADLERRIELAKKRKAGTYDDVTPQFIAHFIADERADLYEQDLTDREDGSEHELYQDAILPAANVGIAPNVWFDPDRQFDKRQQTLEDMLEFLQHYQARGRIAQHAIDEVRDRLPHYGLHLDPDGDGLARLAREYQKLLIEVYKAGLERQKGEVIENPEPPPPISKAALKASSAFSFADLYQAWHDHDENHKRSLSTKEAYRRAASQLETYLGHKDASRVSKKDIQNFKAHRLQQGTSARTLKAGDLSALNVLYKTAVEEDRLHHNPVVGVKTSYTKKELVRDPGFSDEEAARLLRHASSHVAAEREGEKRAAAKKWVPWLQAYTGARLGEMAQLRSEDVYQKDGHWVVRITPEAGTVKTRRFREVPLHPHLVEMGFPEFATKQRRGHLFLSPKDTGNKTSVLKNLGTTKNRLTEFVREALPDTNVQPNHGWRHRFETWARILEIHPHVAAAITGRVIKTGSADSAADYGIFPVPLKAAAIAKFPRFQV